MVCISCFLGKRRPPSSPGYSHQVLRDFLLLVILVLKEAFPSVFVESIQVLAGTISDADRIEHDGLSVFPCAESRRKFFFVPAKTRMNVVPLLLTLIVVIFE